MTEETAASEQQAAVETWKSKTQETADTLLELAEIDFFGIGDRYPLEQMLDNPEAWNNLKAIERDNLLKGASQALGINLLAPEKDGKIHCYHENIWSPEGVDVSVLPTQIPGFELQIMEYQNPQIGTRYDLVRTE